MSSEEQREVAGEIRRVLALSKEVEDLVQIGAYRPGARPEVDRALSLGPELAGVLRQGLWERSSMEDSLAALGELARRPMPLQSADAGAPEGGGA